MKDFTDFKSSLTQEDIDYINTSDLAFSGDIADPDDMREFVGFICDLNFGRMLRLLECYHEWLRKQP